MSILRRAWAKYQQLLITHPWKTQTIGTGVLVAAGDVITQQFAERRGTNHDFRRTARMGVVGLVIGPVLRSWYLTLERIVPGTAKTAGFKKMLLDQSLFAPVMICFFFSVSETLAGKRPHEIKEMFQER
ncbi:unnamed protein product [Porites lobata]|uniref:Mitochondrial inner membrane protein Mpv17 n=1 Tax=Porites lobata TaxID=104759 RepID=A0ABN8RZ93_9CNID|nr:unnamed protein product [Porites lobata]